MSDFLTTCGLPGCWALYEQTEGATERAEIAAQFCWTDGGVR